MNALVLYGRSRRLPVSAGVLAAVAAALWAALRGTRAGPDDLPLAVFVLTGNVVAATLGLGGQDLALDRAAAIRWAPRRAAHVLLLGAAAAGALLAVQALGPDLAPAAVVLRDSAGLAGLAALGAVCFGPVCAWTLPTGWLALTLFVPPPAGRTGQVVHWLLQPAGTTAATATAALLLTAGTALYAALGPRG
ncbi:hypothetical protein ACIQBJ_14975 [Kitasatospora sp. NPDC088391]|uniref:hypothetical protein n=1 Tax=Kitasatospora sp. NPDC088391 TaxID=3364074 RepID=UPI00381BB1A4